MESKTSALSKGRFFSSALKGFEEVTTARMQPFFKQALVTESMLQNAFGTTGRCSVFCVAS